MQTKTKTRLSIFVVLVLFAAAIYGFIHSRPASIPDNLIKVSGRIEGEHHLASTKVAGKIFEVKVAEGDQVKKGQVLAVLDDAQIRAKVTQAAAAYGASLANYKASKTGLSVFEKQTPLQIETSQAQLTHAEAALKAAYSSEEQAKVDLKRMQNLLKKKAVSEHDVESAALNLKTLHAQTVTAQTAVEQARKALDLAKLGWEQLSAKREETEAVKALTLQAQANLMEAMSLLEDMKIRSPIDGVVMTKLINTGEVINAGTGLFDIVNLDQIYLKGYIAENKIGKIHLGLKANLYLDSLPDQPFTTSIRYISSQAEFTPKEVQTQEERVKLVYTIKLYLDNNPQHRVTPGLPADAYIQLQ
ncbi:HlyD family secretion protein [Thiomicrorhabdus sp.]|uniref:HlyD family secretion protein n=1 Tax=Thiomicrorhabdus sp. TaxID=2039724 RepID=UPI0035682DC8